MLLKMVLAGPTLVTKLTGLCNESNLCIKFSMTVAVLFLLLFCICCVNKYSDTNKLTHVPMQLYSLIPRQNF